MLGLVCSRYDCHNCFFIACETVTVMDHLVMKLTLTLYDSCYFIKEVNDSCEIVNVFFGLGLPSVYFASSPVEIWIILFRYVLGS